MTAPNVYLKPFPMSLTKFITGLMHTKTRHKIVSCLFYKIMFYSESFAFTVTSLLSDTTGRRPYPAYS